MSSGKVPMNDDPLERALRDALLRDDPGPVRPELRARISAIPDEAAGQRARRPSWVSGLGAAAAAVAAVVVLGVAVFAIAGLRGSIIGPTTSARPSDLPTAPGIVASATPQAVGPTTGETAWTGLRWSARGALPSDAWINVLVPFGGQLVAAGRSGCCDGGVVAFWRSSDGTTWTEISRGDPAFADAQLDGLTATPTGLVAWGSIGRADCTSVTKGFPCPAPPMVWTSPDGATWTRVADVSMFAGGSIATITDGPAGLVAIGDTGWDAPAIWTSATGASWQRLTLGPAFADAHFSSVRAGGPGYVLAGGTGGQLISVTGGDPVMAPLHAAAWWSPDGRTWTKSTIDQAGGAGSSLGLISVAAHGLVAVGSTPDGRDLAAWTSADGRTWRRVAFADSLGPSPAPGTPSLPSFVLADDGTRIVAYAVGDQSAIRWWVSTDGLSWQPLSMSGATDSMPASHGDPAQAYQWLDRVFVAPGGLVVTGGGVTGYPVMTPVWFGAGVVPSALPGPPSVIASAPTSASASAPAQSPGPTPLGGTWSGLRWSSRGTIPSDVGIKAIVSVGDRLVAAGRAGSVGNDVVAIWGSSDGTTWSELSRGDPVFADAELDGLIATPTGLVAWGRPYCAAELQGYACTPAPPRLWTSPDGATWTAVDDVSMFAGGRIAGIVEGPAGIVAAGDTGWDSPAIWVSATGGTWHRLTLGPAFAAAHFTSVRAGGPGYVLGGGTGTQQVQFTGGQTPMNVPLHAAGWWSADGQTWAQATIEAGSGGGSDLGSIAVAAGGLVALGQGPGYRADTTWTSLDGRTWRQVDTIYLPPRSSAGAPTLSRVNLSGDGAIIVASGEGLNFTARWWVSTDGANWRELAQSGATGMTPAWNGNGQTSWSIDRAFVVRGGLLVTGGMLTGDPLVTPVLFAASVP